MAKNLPPSVNFGRQQRNIPTEPDKTAYDPDFGKPKPTDIKPPGSEKTQIKPKPGSASAPTEKMTRLPNLLEEQLPRTDLEEIEKAARGEATIKNAPKRPPEPMEAADLKKELIKAQKTKPGKPGKVPDLKKMPPGERLPEGTPGLAKYEKTKKPGKPTKIKPKPGKGLGLGAKTGSVLKNIGKIVGIGAITGVLVFAILDHLGVVVFEHAAEEVLEKMGPKTDLSDYLPGGAKAKKVIWSNASYRRYSPYMGEAPLSTWLAEEITLQPPQNGILAFGISIGDWPDDIVVSDINVNELDDGQSDWLCEGYQENLICRSLGSYPLSSKLKTIVTLHLASWPAYEVDKMLAAGGGSRSVYFIVK